MISRGEIRCHVAQWRSLKARGLHMIQRPTSGTLDLELCNPTHTGEKSFAVTAPEFFQHLQIPFACIPRPWAANPRESTRVKGVNGSAYSAADNPLALIVHR